ncbi:MAG TPA: methyltransferase domain-containing protein [Bryobacteraceae bacterium]|nr:methyltransferase domain-containing protein [Bryobacteraceae bacterium]
MHAQAHQSDTRILGRRTLQRDHSHLAGLLRPGLDVLDVGCGTGAITVGIARAVGIDGLVVGVDRDTGLLEIARREHQGIANLRFELADAIKLPFHARFDIVTAARTLQWIGEPGEAVARMKQAAKPSGCLVVLDYNHAQNQWEPDPPVEFQAFYRAFLSWRDAARWDNEMADHLPALFESAGLVDIDSHVQDEIAQRGDEAFAEQAALWSQVMENVGEQISRAGFFQESRLRETREGYKAWTRTELRKQVLKMRAVVATVV